jgi:hypothetical protein
MSTWNQVHVKIVKSCIHDICLKLSCQHVHEYDIMCVETPTAAMYKTPSTPTSARSSQCARVGLYKIGADNDTITGPVGRLYLWKEWNTRTAVDAGRRFVDTGQEIPFSSSTVRFRSLPPGIEPFVCSLLVK